MTGEAARPYSIRMFLPSGSPEGVRVLEKSNWTGVGIYVPRGSFLKARKEREELSRAGVYILVGAGEGGEKPSVYVGQAEVLGNRLGSHYQKREWNWVLAFTSKDASLNRAHFLWLEARLIELARDAKRAHIENDQLPQPPQLSEAEVADVESFFHDVLSIIPLVGLRAFERLPEPDVKQSLLLEARGVKAAGAETQDGFVVHAGSQMAQSETKTCHQHFRSLRQTLQQEGIVVDRNGEWVFSQDWESNSPSMAAGVVLGRSVNGRTAWKSRDGRTLRELQEAATSGETE